MKSINRKSRFYNLIVEVTPDKFYLAQWHRPSLGQTLGNVAKAVAIVATVATVGALALAGDLLTAGASALAEATFKVMGVA